MSRKLHLRLIHKKKEKQLSYSFQKATAVVGIIGTVLGVLLGVVSLILSIKVDKIEMKIEKMDSLLMKNDELIDSISSLTISTNKNFGELQLLVKLGDSAYYQGAKQIAINNQGLQYMAGQLNLMDSNKRLNYKTDFFKAYELIKKMSIGEDDGIQLHGGNAGDDLVLTLTSKYIPLLEEGFKNSFILYDSVVFKKWNFLHEISTKLDTNIKKNKKWDKSGKSIDALRYLQMSIRDDKIVFKNAYFDLKYFFDQIALKNNF